MKVLLAIDGSQSSQAAVSSVLHSKFVPDTQYKVVTVVDTNEPLPAIEGLKEQELAHAQKLVAETSDDLRQAFPMSEISGAVLDGYVAKSIVHSAKDWSADLIVLGSHGRTGMSEFLLGNTAHGVLLQAPCAVRVVKQSSDISKGIGKVLIALDGSQHSRHALEHVLASPWTEGTQFKCVTVLPDLKGHVFFNMKTNKLEDFEGLAKEQWLGAVVWLEKCIARLTQAFGENNVSYEVLQGDARAQIIEAAKSWPAELIILGSHGRKPVERFILGSVSEAMVLYAPCSVEVTRMPEQSPTEITTAQRELFQVVV